RPGLAGERLPPALRFGGRGRPGPPRTRRRRCPRAARPAVPLGRSRAGRSRPPHRRRPEPARDGRGAGPAPAGGRAPERGRRRHPVTARDGLRGYSLPLSPTGRSALVPAPPWHFSGEVVMVEYRAEPDAVAAFLPRGLDGRGF